MHKPSTSCAIFLAVFFVSNWASAETAPVDQLVQTVRKVGPGGQGNAEAAQAVDDLAQSDAAALPAIFKGFTGSSPVVENWLRGVVETIVDRTIAAGGKLPVEELEIYVLDREQSPRGRRLAFECVMKVDKLVADRVIPQMLQDPSSEFRRDAVARATEAAKELHNRNKKDEAIKAYQHALSGAVDDDQVKVIESALNKLGAPFSMQKHFGFLTNWHMIGPFDNRKRIGFKASYPPEQEIDLAKAYEGQLGEVKWAELTTDDKYGLVDIAKKIQNYKGSVMYAYTTFDSVEKRDVEIRLGTPNAWTLWVNGERLFGREEYHRGFSLDQFRVKAKLRAGENANLLKVCQDENEQDWAQRYQLELRVCDQAGAAVHPKSDQTAQAAK